MSAAEFDPDKSHEALERAAHERAVREFFARKEKASPAKAAAVFAKFPTLTERQMLTRQKKESGSFDSYDRKGRLIDNFSVDAAGHLNTSPVVQAGVGTPDRRLRRNRPPATGEQRARKFLLGLPPGRHPARALIDRAKVAGHSEPTLQRARRDLGIETTKEVYAGPSFWTIPDRRTKKSGISR